MKNKYTTINYDFLKKSIGNDEVENVAKILRDLVQQEKVCTTDGHPVIWAKKNFLDVIKDTGVKNTLADILIHDENVILDFSHKDVKSAVSQEVHIAGKSNEQNSQKTPGHDVLWAKNRGSNFKKSNSGRKYKTDGHDVIELKPGNFGRGGKK